MVLLPWMVRLAKGVLAPTGCSPWGPARVEELSSSFPWQVLHSTITPLWPWSWVAATLSLDAGLAFGHSAWVAPWQPSHIRPLVASDWPWPVSLTPWTLTR